MTTIILRKEATESLVAHCFLHFMLLLLYLGVITLLVLTVFVIAQPTVLFVCFLLFACVIVTLIIPVQSIQRLLKYFHMHKEKYILTEREMLCYEKEALVRRIPKEDFRLIGVFTEGRIPQLFFCCASDEEIEALAETNWEKRILAYSSEEIEKLEKTQAGIWQMKVTVFLQFAAQTHKDKVVMVDGQNQKRRNEVYDLWEIKPFLAGAEANKFAEFYSGERNF